MVSIINNLLQIGNPCGFENDTISIAKDYPYVYWIYFDTDEYDKHVCVKECPSSTGTVECIENSFMDSYYYDGCQYGYGDAALRYDTSLYFGSWCLPSKESAEGIYDEFLANITAQYGASNVGVWIGDLVNVWEMLPIGAGIAFLLGFIFMLLIYLLAGVIIWLSIVFIFLGIVAGGFFCYSKYDDEDTEEDNKKYY